MKIKDLMTPEGKALSMQKARDALKKIGEREAESMNAGDLDPSNPDTLDRLLRINSNTPCETSILVENRKKYA